MSVTFFIENHTQPKYKFKDSMYSEFSRIFVLLHQSNFHNGGPESECVVLFIF